MADTWEGVSKAAMKILGDKGKIPKISSAIPKAAAADDKSYDEFNKSRNDLKAKLLATQTAGEARKDAVIQFQDEIEEDNLGLDPKDKEDAKKIASARKILMDFLQDRIDIGNDNFKNLRELDKHLMSITNYKPSS